MCELGTASILRVLASGSPADHSCSAHLTSVTCPFLGTARGGGQGAGELCQTLVGLQRVWGCLHATGILLYRCAVVCPKVSCVLIQCLRWSPGGDGTKHRGINQVVIFYFFFPPNQWVWVDPVTLTLKLIPWIHTIYSIQYHLSDLSWLLDWSRYY